MLYFYIKLEIMDRLFRILLLLLTLCFGVRFVGGCITSKVSNKPRIEYDDRSDHWLHKPNTETDSLTTNNQL